MKRKKGFFSISAVAEMFSVHQQTIRLYEKEGLITPKRSDGNTRLFSEEDVDRLEEIIYLTHQLGINLAGVEMILKLKKQIKKMQKDMNRLFDNTQKELDKESEVSQHLVKSTAKQLLTLKYKQTPIEHPQELLVDNAKHTDIPTQAATGTNWEVEYDE